MIVVKVIGGLGNQLFQYAVGRYLSLKNNTDLKIDATGFTNYSLRKFELSKYDIPINFAERDELPVEGKERNKIKIFVKNLFSPGIKVINEKNFHFDANILKVGNNTYLDGYWQSEKYFESVKETIKKDIVCLNMLNEEQQKVYKLINKSNSISIHIRRGDYVNNPVNKKIYECLSSDYYNKAIELLSSFVNDPYYFIFSDDIEWVKQNLSFKGNYTFVNGNEAWTDLQLMACCKHNIIANSTFSWWGAYLGSYNNKKVIAPKKWFHKNAGFDTKDLIPETWIKL